MDRDASLDDFLDTASSEEPDETPETDASETEGGVADRDAEPETESGNGDAVPETQTVEPARSTGRWDPVEGVCDACGASVAGRWRETAADESEDTFVCVECKSW